MIILFNLAIIFCVLSVVFDDKNRQRLHSYNFDEYLSRDVTASIKGVFIIVVFFRHVFPYLLNGGYMPNWTDSIFMRIDGHIQQLLVVMFLFYSGFGVSEAARNKGRVYLKSFPKTRILHTWLNFDIAVLVFVIMLLTLDENVELKKFVISLFAWESIGNSNWYIFCILYCYLATYVSLISINSNRHRLLMMFSLCALYIVVIDYFKSGQTYWYNTIMAYPLGMFWSVNRTHIEKVITKIGWWKSIIIATVVFIPLHFAARDIMAILSNLQAVVFTIIVLLLTVRIRFKSKALIWLGLNLFPLYIYQRVPMVLLSKWDNGEFMLTNPYIYVILCAVLTLPFVYLFRLMDTRRVVGYLKDYIIRI